MSQTIPTVDAKPTVNKSSDQQQNIVNCNSLITYVINSLGSALRGEINGLLSSGATLSIASTDTQIATSLMAVVINGVTYTVAAAAAGVAITPVTVTANKWAIFLGQSDTSATVTWTGASGNATGYATEALAIAALPTATANKAPFGYVTTLTKAATAWIAATDAFAGGASGNPASITNYYPYKSLIDVSNFTGQLIYSMQGNLIKQNIQG